MKSIPKKKIWRVNIVADYQGEKTPVSYRKPIVSILYNLARLCRLDVAISYNHRFDVEEHSDTPQNTGQSVSDLFYLRSTSQSYVQRKTFQKLIEDVFQGNGFYYPVFVYCMYQKDNKKYPFPLDFERPLEYPVVDVHSAGQVSRCIETEFLQKEFQKERDDAMLN